MSSCHVSLNQLAISYQYSIHPLSSALTYTASNRCCSCIFCFPIIGTCSTVCTIDPVCIFRALVARWHAVCWKCTSYTHGWKYKMKGLWITLLTWTGLPFCMALSIYFVEDTIFQLFTHYLYMHGYFFPNFPIQSKCTTSGVNLYHHYFTEYTISNDVKNVHFVSTYVSNFHGMATCF